MTEEEAVPVALFAYARPEHLKKVVLGLKRNHVPLIYAFVDGPKDEKVKENNEEVIRIIEEINWCKIILHTRENNFGLAKSIRSGITEVLTKHDRILVVEDDIVLRPGAYKFVVNSLKNFENDPRVMTLSLWSHKQITDHNCKYGYYSKRFICWGWATYKKYWDLYQEEPFDLYTKLEFSRNEILKWGADIEWQALNAEKRNLWYVGYLLKHFELGKLSYFPKEMYAINIGNDGSGQNTGINQHDNVSLIDVPIVNINKWDNFNGIFVQNKFFKFFQPKKSIFKNVINDVIVKIKHIIKY